MRREIGTTGVRVCGIFASLDVSIQAHEAPWNLLAHRGPDDAGIFRDRSDRCVLGHRRLAVVDIEGGKQPFLNEDASVAVVFNGEIYGFRRLRDTLESLGHHFRSKSDTEVLIHGWEEWGTELCGHLDGEFAFALWDQKSKSLFFARDRFGVKPIYYARSGSGLLLASEAKALFACEAFNDEIAPQFLTHFLAFGFIPAPHTIWKAVRKLEPGTWASFDGTTLNLKRYWYPRVQTQSALTSIDESCERTRKLLSESVRDRLIADVPLGIFLSGGVDSSSIAAAAAMEDPSVMTFSAAFEEPRWDESRWASAVASHLGTTHRTCPVGTGGLDLLPTLVWHFDEPFGDSSAIPTFLISQKAREFVTTVLGGDAGDELFGGYLYYQLEREVQEYQAWSPFRRRLSHAAWSCLDAITSKRFGRCRRRQARLEEADVDLATRRFAWGNLHDDRSLRELLLKEVFDDDYLSIPRQVLDECDAPDSVAALMHLDQCFGLPNDMLTKVDRMSMANGLEVRVPFLARELSDHALSTLPREHVRGTRLKNLLKSSVEGWLPPGIVDRRKQGFCVPLHAWFQGEAGSKVEAYLLGDESLSTAYLDAQAIRNLLRKHQTGERELGEQIWHLAALETFLRTWDETRLQRPLEITPWGTTAYS